MSETRGDRPSSLLLDSAHPTAAALFVGQVGADASKVNYIPFSGDGESLVAPFVLRGLGRFKAQED